MFNTNCSRALPLVAMAISFGARQVEGLLAPSCLPSTIFPSMIRETSFHQPLAMVTDSDNPRPVDDIVEARRPTDCYIDQTNVTLAFPSYVQLMDCNIGEYVTSESFYCGDAEFCVKLYPRGGGHRRGGAAISSPSGTKEESEQGFGMAYRVLPSLKSQESDLRNQHVGMYLKYLGKRSRTPAASDIVDATFALRLKGNQQSGPKFDVEWRAGMRFVPPNQKTELTRGRANDFGAHLMRTPFLEEFLGVCEDSANESRPVIANVAITLHDTEKELLLQRNSGDDPNATKGEGKNENPFFSNLANDIRIPPGMASKEKQHDGTRVRVGKIFVPLLNKLNQRPKMFQNGVYPGVEYRILRILDPETGNERFTSCPGCEYEIRPIYPLVPELERPWPVRVDEADIPRLFTPNMYNAVSAAGSLLVAVVGLAAAFLLSQTVSLFFIPSRSMDPTLQIGDVLLVDKISPKILKSTQMPGDIVLFTPPRELEEIVAANGGKLSSRDLFVKRIAAKSGDYISVDSSGQVAVNGKPAFGRRDLCTVEPLRLIEKYIKTTDIYLNANEVFVMGDCSGVSIDSRVWGPLPISSIAGKPILRLWPLDRFGPLPALEPMTTTYDAWRDPSEL